MKPTPVDPRLLVVAAGALAACTHRSPEEARPTPLILPADPGFVRHLLQRFTFGPRPGDVAKVQAAPGAWLEGQLSPATLPDAAGDAALTPYKSELAAPEELYETLQAAIDDSKEVEAQKKGRRMMLREMGGRLQMTALARHISSERQLFEVMVDFWTNHFNVFAQKGQTGLVTADFVEHAIRPHALGRFENLLLATARHPAMLIYLDNWRSVANAVFQKQGKGARGINENYGRELLELHTLGVDGGYSQTDVVEVARILTGWTVEAPGRGSFEFIFRQRVHDYGDKVVLGQKYRGEGEPEGRKLITQLAAHPSTAKHLATKLCQRFVADDPPATLVAKVAQSYLASGGDIAAMVRAIALSPEFADPAVRGVKIKSPLRFVASSVRALGGVTDGTDQLAKVVGRLGQPLFYDPVPTGYPEVSKKWLNASALLGRMNIASAIASEKVGGITMDLEALVPSGVPTDKMVARLDEVIFGGAARPETTKAIASQAGTVPNPDLSRALALTMALGSPDFQRS